MDKPKASIEVVTNGFIVRVIRTGLQMFKDPYVKPVMVFQDWDDAAKYLKAVAHGISDYEEKKGTSES